MLATIAVRRVAPAPVCTWPTWSRTAAHTSPTLCSRASRTCGTCRDTELVLAPRRRDISRRIGDLWPLVCSWLAQRPLFLPLFAASAITIAASKARGARLAEPTDHAPTALPSFADARRLAARARWPQRQFCMVAAALGSLVAYMRSTNIDLRGNFSKPRERCLGAPEAAHPLLAGSRLYSACEPNGWATFSLLVLAPAHLNRDGGGNKEVIRPDCRTVAQRGRNSARWHCQSLAPAHPQRIHQLRAGEA